MVQNKLNLKKFQATSVLIVTYDKVVPVTSDGVILTLYIIKSPLDKHREHLPMCGCAIDKRFFCHLSLREYAGVEQPLRWDNASEWFHGASYQRIDTTIKYRASRKVDLSN